MRKIVFAVLTAMIMTLFMINAAMAAGTPVTKQVNVTITVPSATTVSDIPALAITAVPGVLSTGQAGFSVNSNTTGVVTAAVTTPVTGLTGDPVLSASILGAGTFIAGTTPQTLSASITVSASQVAGTFTGGKITVTVTPD